MAAPLTQLLWAEQVVHHAIASPGVLLHVPRVELGTHVRADDGQHLVLAQRPKLSVKYNSNEDL
jgi:hypothetical protein